MFSVLPDLTARDPHSLWYTSSRNPNYAALSALDPSSSSDHYHHHPHHAPTAGGPMPGAGVAPPNPTQNTPAIAGAGPNAPPLPTLTTPAGTAHPPHHHHHHHNPATTAHIIERSPLGRLHAEEALLARRRAAVTNLGSTWLKPPGVAKTLFQMREEQREAEEAAEAQRREAQAAELAEAEAEAAAQAAAEAMGGEVGVEGDVGGGGVGGMGDDMMMMMGEEGEEEGRDLDADIPDADDGAGFGYDGLSEDDEEEEEEGEEEEEEDEEEGEEEEGEEEHEMSHLQIQQQRRAQQRELASRMANMRATEDRMRQLMARGSSQDDHVGEAVYGVEDEIDEEDHGQMLDEDNLGEEENDLEEVLGPDVDLEMEADLDDDIPEAEGGGYEHTDSEALPSSDDESHNDISYARSSRALPRDSLRRSEAPRSSLDISGLLSRDGSSFMGSSPQIRRANQ